jgi:creatinine amidohydrolase
MTRLAEMTRGEAREAAAGSILVLPLGATEQHGPHLPAGTDALICGGVAERVAERLEGQVPVVVAPTLWFGNSAHHLPFGATLSLGTETYLHVLMDLGRSAVASGFRRLFFLNGHGGNHELIQLAARDLALQHPLDAAAGSYWVIAQEALREAAGGEAATIPGHAGTFETSMIMALSPHLVREPRPSRPAAPALKAGFEVPLRVERHGSWQAIDGFSDSPAGAGAELGQALLEAAVGAVADALRDFHEATRTG